MGIFDKVLSSGESIFKNEVALSYDFVPKLVPFRENQQFRIANCIKPIFNKMNGRNAVIFGPPGIGKTVATKHVLRELEEETDDIIPLYINCWQKGTSYKIYLDICDQLEYKFTHNKRTEELLDIIKRIINKKAAVFTFDEIDKAEDPNFIYSLLEEIHYKSIICLTNEKSWSSALDKRIMSRFNPETIEFQPYTRTETEGILKERIQLAFHSGVVQDDALQLVTDKTFERKDMRTGLYLLKEAGLAAEDRSSRTLEKEDVAKAIEKMQDFKIKDVDELEEEHQDILKIIKEKTPIKIGDLYKSYQENGGNASYKTFQRRIQKLQENKFVSIKKQIGGSEGTTTIIHYDATNRQLNEF